MRKKQKKFAKGYPPPQQSVNTEKLRMYIFFTTGHNSLTRPGLHRQKMDAGKKANVYNPAP